MKPDNWMPASGARMSWDAMQSESEPPVASIALLECPWCGELPDAVRPHPSSTIVRILCRSGDCRVNPDVSAYSYEEAAKRWNTRHSNDRDQARPTNQNHENETET